MITKQLEEEMYKLLETDTLKNFKEESEGKTGKEFQEILIRYNYSALDYDKVDDLIKGSFIIEDKVVEYLEMNFKEGKNVPLSSDELYKIKNFNDYMNAEMRNILNNLLYKRGETYHYSRPPFVSEGYHGERNTVFGYDNKEYLYCESLYSADTYLVNEELLDWVTEENDNEYAQGVSTALNKVEYYYVLKEREVLKRKRKQNKTK